MAISRINLRQAIGHELRELVTGAIDEATTTTLMDYDLIDSLADSKYVSGWVHLTSGPYAGVTRRISGYDETTGTLTVSRSWDTPPVSSTYEIHTKLAPEEWNRIINAALVTLPYEVTQTIPYVEGQNEYSLAAYTWITKPGQVIDVHWKYGDTALEYVYYPVYRWRVALLDGVLTLLVPGGEINGDLVITCHRVYDTLDEDSDETDCPEDWIRSAIKVRALDLMRQTAPADDARRYIEQWQQEMALLQRKHAQYRPAPRMTIHAPGVI